MPKPSAIELLPPPIKAAVDQELAKTRFSNLDGILAMLQEKLEKEGLEVRISRSALGHYSRTKLQPLLARIELSTKMAEAIANAYPDTEGNVNEAILRLVQESLFQKLVDIEQDGISSKELASISQATAQIVKASTSAKRYKEEVKQKLEAKFAEIAPRNGIDAETLRVIREEVYGIVM